MKRFFATYFNSPAQLAFFFAAVLVVSITFSPFLLSISMWGLVAASFWQVGRSIREQGKRVTVVELFVISFRNLFRQPGLWLMALLLLLPALSGFWSDDHAYWLERTRVRIPFFVLPWVFANFPALERRQYQTVLYLFVWTLVLICIGVGINLLLHFDTMLNNLSKGQPIPVPRHHIRFNLMLAVGILSGGWLYLQQFFLRYRWERKLLLGAVLFLFAFIHVLSVRSGLAALYTALLFTVFYFVWHTKRWKMGIAALAILALAPVIAVQTMPSLQHRLSYMLWDWQQYRENKGSNYSDSERWVSLEAGLEIWKKQPWLGAGAGDLPTEVKQFVAQKYPDYAGDPRLPHNQFVYILAGTGIVGLLLSLLAFAAPLLYGWRRHTYLFWVFQIMVFVSFLVEYTIETAMGVAWYLFFTLFFSLIPPSHSGVGIGPESI